MIIRTPTATVAYSPDGAISTYADGASYGAQPHDTHHYHLVAHRCGYGDDVMAYAREHEVFHHLVGARFYGGPSPVLWALAHGQDVTPEAAAVEEAMVMTCQRWVRANERPIIGGVDWDGFRGQALGLLDAA